MKKFRDQGATGALLDEYQKAVAELQFIIQDVSDSDLINIVDHKTEDTDCRSIQTILSHVISAGYGYSILISNHQAGQLPFPQKKSLDTASEYIKSLDKMFAYCCTVFKDYPDIKLEEYNSQKKIVASWGQRYDVEQLMEHAIVHILRHRRQIERFILKLNAIQT